MSWIGKLRYVLRTLLTGWMFCFFGIADLSAKEEETAKAPVPSGLEVFTPSQGRVLRAVLPGQVVATAQASSGGPLAILVAMDETARQEGARGPRGVYLLDYRLDHAGEGSLTPWAMGLSKKAEALHFLPSADDGSEVLVVGEKGKLWALGSVDRPSSGPQKLLVAPEVDLQLLQQRDLIRTEPLRLWQAAAGNLTIFTGAVAALAATGRLPLPLEVSRRSRGLRLSTPPVHGLPAHRGTDPVFPELLAVGPQASGPRRLLTTLVNPTAASEEEANQEAWALLPAAESVESSWYVRVDGRPMLVVTTTNAEKVGVFEKLKVRVFPLRTDRTRAGSPSTLSFETTTRRWYQVDLRVMDWNLDGRDDLLFLQPDGLGAKKLVVEVYFGKGNGGFLSRSRRTVLVAPDAEWHFGKDLNGDGRADLVTLSENGLEIFPGLAADHKKLTVAKDAFFTVTPASLQGAGFDQEPNGLEWSSPQVVHFTQEGGSALLARSRAGKRTVLWMVEIVPSSH